MIGMASPDWQAIFTRRPDLNPPGFDQTMNDMRNNPWRDPKHKIGPNKAKTELNSARGKPLIGR